MRARRVWHAGVASRKSHVTSRAVCEMSRGYRYSGVRVVRLMCPRLSHSQLSDARPDAGPRLRPRAPKRPRPGAPRFDVLRFYSRVDSDCCLYTPSTRTRHSKYTRLPPIRAYTRWVHSTWSVVAFRAQVRKCRKCAANTHPPSAEPHCGLGVTLTRAVLSALVYNYHRDAS